MQNRCNNGCGTSAGCGTSVGCDAGFVPVTNNWNFNVNGDCGCKNSNRCNQRQASNRTCSKSCNECGNNRNRNTERNQTKAACQCERCEDERTVQCCDKNTYVREQETDCGCTQRTQTASCTCKEGCTCETCMRNRNRSACYEQNTYSRERENDCGCKNSSNSYGRSRNSQVGMISAPIQEIEELFESESALRAGTLFPELHKPLNGYCPYDCYCGTCAQEAAFAAWELRLYLNTHPHDEKALALFRKLCKEAEEDNYATTFLTDECCTEHWNWVKNPWPWEYDCQCGD